MQEDPPTVPADPPRRRERIERGFFMALLVLLTVGFVWVVLPYWGAVMWGFVLALLFEPMCDRVARRWRGRRGWAAAATLLVILLIVVLPLTLVGFSLVREATGIVQRVQSGDIDFGRYFDRVVSALPSWASGWLERSGVSDVAAVQDRVVAAITTRGQALAARALDYGSDALDYAVGFCMAMYLLFFLLKDGQPLAREVKRCIPLDAKRKNVLVERFTTVLRATVKGNILVAMAQGALGGLAFWVLGVHAPMLWAVVMAFLSLLPAVGAALIWAPVALYLVATGQVWQGIGLALFGVFVIGLIDNVLRPVLVGKDTAMPDYVVLITTVGGLTVVGINGFVVGPLVAALFITAWQLLAAERGARA